MESSRMVQERIHPIKLIKWIGIFFMPIILISSLARIYYSDSLIIRQDFHNLMRLDESGMLTIEFSKDSHAVFYPIDYKGIYLRFPIDAWIACETPGIRDPYREFSWMELLFNIKILTTRYCKKYPHRTNTFLSPNSYYALSINSCPRWMVLLESVQCDDVERFFEVHYLYCCELSQFNTKFLEKTDYGNLFFMDIDKPIRQYISRIDSDTFQVYASLEDSQEISCESIPNLSEEIMSSFSVLYGDHSRR